MLFSSGALVGQLSGKLGPIVASHNKGGPYFRAHVVPVTATTTFALNAKARLSAASQLWQTLTQEQQEAWLTWANNNPVTNRIGQSITLSGHGAFTGLTSRLAIAGVAAVLDPPVIPAPAPLLTLAATFDIGVGEFDLIFTTTPLAADAALYIQTAVFNSAGINFVQNLLKLLAFSPAAQASPFDIEAQTALRFGTLLVGQRVVHQVSTVDIANGQLSTPLRIDGTIISTV